MIIIGKRLFLVKSSRNWTLNLSVSHCRLKIINMLIVLYFLVLLYD